MELKKTIFIYFFISGLLGGLIGTSFLLYFVGTENSYIVLGFKQKWLFYVFPLISALVSGFIAVYMCSPDFGPLKGISVSVLSFIVFNLILSFIGPGGPVTAIGYMMFGFIYIGWLLLIIGAITGWFVKRSNKTFSSEAKNASAN